MFCLRFVLTLCYVSFDRYFSPYPLTESEAEEHTPAPSHPPPDANRIAGVSRTTFRSHGRTSDLLAGGLMRDHSGGAEGGNVLWVCDRCFKYMSEGTSWESHMVGFSSGYGSGLGTDVECDHVEEMQHQSSTREEGLSEGCAYHLGSRWCEGKGRFYN